MLELDDHWVWDFWHVVDDDGRHHLFHLKAPHTIGDPELRHWHVAIGHVVSDDLRGWEARPDALAPGDDGAFDDYTTWTGSIVQHEGVWHMLYTGTSKAEDGQVQRVGLATSDDLVTWHRQADPVLEADPRWYEVMHDERHDWHDQAWRDPWVFRDPGSGSWHAYVTARSAEGHRAGRGVVGHARSRDLRTWEVLPPVTQPFGFGQLEVPQLLHLEGRWYLLFCSDVDTQGPDVRDRVPGTGTYYLRGDGPFGPFATEAEVVEADAHGSTYAGRVVDTEDGPMFLAWNRTDETGRFVGTITPPRRVVVAPDGHLQLEEP